MLRNQGKEAGVTDSDSDVQRNERIASISRSSCAAGCAMCTPSQAQACLYYDEPEIQLSRWLMPSWSSPSSDFQVPGPGRGPGGRDSDRDSDSVGGSGLRVKPGPPPSRLTNRFDLFIT